MVRPFILLSNWEAYRPLEATLSTIEKLVGNAQLSKSQHYVCLPYDYLREGREKLLPLNLTLGANDLNSVESGTFTESIATRLLSDVSAQFVLLGRSLQRTFLKESPASINKKIHSALEAHIQPFLCFGESYSDFEEGKGPAVNQLFLQECFKDIPA
jgi:triosephosphate isomerase